MYSFSPEKRQLKTSIHILYCWFMSNEEIAFSVYCTLIIPTGEASPYRDLWQGGTKKIIPFLLFHPKTFPLPWCKMKLSIYEKFLAMGCSHWMDWRDLSVCILPFSKNGSVPYATFSIELQNIKCQAESGHSYLLSGTLYFKWQRNISQTRY